MAERPFAWERSYPPGVRWDAPIVLSTLGELLTRAVAEFGPRPAIEFRDRTISFDRLGEEARRIGAALLRAGIGHGTPLALYLPNTIYHPFAFFGGVTIGARLVHLSPLDAERELAHKLADSGARALVTTNAGSLLALAIRLAEQGLLDRIIVGEDEAWGAGTTPASSIPDHPAVVRWSGFVAGAPEPTAWPRVVPEDIALLQYTGGTTGVPKGAMLTHANLTAANAIYDVWAAGQGLLQRGTEKVICVLPLFHVYALTAVLLRQVKNGNEILLRPRFDVETTLRDIEVKRATAFPGVPTMWMALVNHAGIAARDLSSLTRCSSGGAPLPVEVAQRFERLTGHTLRGGWGMTETCSPGTNLPGKGAVRSGSIGLPLPGIEIDVVALDDPRRLLPAGEIGELRIAGPNVTPGYWNRPAETANAFVDGRLLTGDIGYMDDDGYFFLVDRKKDMIISGGFNIYPQMIEQAVYEHAQVEEALVIGIADPHLGEVPKVFVKLRQGATGFTLEELKQFLADKVGRHEMPRALEFRAALPRTSVGKLSKLELRDAERRTQEKLRRSA